MDDWLARGVRWRGEGGGAVVVVRAPGAPETRTSVGFCSVPAVYQTRERLMRP